MWTGLNWTVSWLTRGVKCDKDDGQVGCPTMKTHPTDENSSKRDLIFQRYRSTRTLLGHFTSFKYLHYLMTLCVNWRSLRKVSSMLLTPSEISLTCGKWPWHSTLSSGARILKSSTLLPSRFCTHLKETLRQWRHQAKMRWTMSASRRAESRKG